MHNTKMYCTECGKKLRPTQKFCTRGEPMEIAATLLQDDSSHVVKAERKTQVVKEISDNDEISIITPSKYKSNLSSGPVSQSEARQAVLDSHRKQKIKDREKMMVKTPSAYGMNPLSVQPPP